MFQKFFLLFLSVLLSGVLSHAQVEIPVESKGGFTVGNGGDRWALEFIEEGRSILQKFKKNKLKNPPFAVEDFERIIDETLVTSEERVFIHHSSSSQPIEVDAVNYFPTENRIVVSQRRWSRKINARSAIVFHEYLTLLGLDDRQYKISARYFLNQLRRPPVFP